MKVLQVVNVSRNAPLGDAIRVAASLWERGVGLLGSRHLAPGEGMWLSPCQSIHTLFMRFPIDALFLDSQGVVLHQKTLVPWRVSRWVRGSRGVLELPAGTLRQTGTEPGDRIQMSPLAERNN
jgi:uncharacterized membrane protein (UPF0127 family)